MELSVVQYAMELYTISTRPSGCYHLSSAGWVGANGRANKAQLSGSLSTDEIQHSLQHALNTSAPGSDGLRTRIFSSGTLSARPSLTSTCGGLQVSSQLV